jgi:NAD(P)-dependent dehydrogenase (short-subunit alcohol dehydrogenase family)
MRRPWTADDVPPQSGKTAIITGGSSGLGFETAKVLARAGAVVTIASQNASRGAAAVRRIGAEAPAAQVDFVQLDTSSLESVGRFAEQMDRRLPQLDILVNCAGIAAVARRETSVDGLERQLATNYLGHFALTGRLLPPLRRAHAARVISISSLSHIRGRIHFGDLQLEHGYRSLLAYEQSKLAVLLFAFELCQRARQAGLDLLSVAVHPGLARTGIANRARSRMSAPRLVWSTAAHVLGQSAAQGALPVLYAATSPDVVSGAYYGPDGFGELRGSPAPARIAPRARDREAAGRLWDTSERLTGVVYPFEAGQT